MYKDHHSQHPPSIQKNRLPTASFIITLPLSPQLPVRRPSILLQKLVARSLECIIRPEIARRHRLPRDGVERVGGKVAGQHGAVERVAARGDDGVLHDFKGNVVDQVVGNDLDR